MLDSAMLDPLGSLVLELRADADVAALVDARVRGGEPGPDDGQIISAPDEPVRRQSFVVLTTIDRPPHPSIPIQRAVYGLRCYGTTFQNAAAVYGAVAKAVHKVGARMKASGLGIYISVMDGGGSQDKDPDTKQPVVEGTIRVIATAQPVSPEGS